MKCSLVSWQYLGLQTTFVLRQSQEKNLTKKLLHFAYIDLEEAFD